MKSNKKLKAYLLRLLTKKKNLSFDLKKSKRVLILKYDRIGDMVVTTPIFRELKTAYPNISISVLASEENKDVIRYNPYIDKIYTNYKNSILKDLSTLLESSRPAHWPRAQRKVQRTRYASSSTALTNTPVSTPILWAA